MDKRFHIKPYSFRGRLLLFLFLAALAACIISAVGSFMINIASLHRGLESTEHETAIYLLSLQQKTTLNTDDMLALTANETVEIDQVSHPDWTLSDEQLQALASGELLTITSGLTSMPTTYLQLGSDIIRIHPTRDFNLYLSLLPRVVFTLVLTLVLFAVSSAVISFRLARPVTQMTKAMKQIEDGDFSVRLPNDQNGEMGELMRSFNGMTEALSRTAYLQKDFISSISHEFRTPIASIKGFAKLVQMPGLEDAARLEYVNMIAQESDRLSRLSDTLLRLSALEQQMAPASLSSFRLDEQLRQVILQLEPAWAPRDIEWQLNLEELTIESDAELLMQVWINLIQNAIKFSPDHSTIEIDLVHLNTADVTITDHGAGMSEETMARIFDRFYQGDTSRSKEGVGLGLCLVKRIVEMLDGSVRVRSELGKGSSFRVRLPLHAAHKEET